MLLLLRMIVSQLLLPQLLLLFCQDLLLVLVLLLRTVTIVHITITLRGPCIGCVHLGRLLCMLLQ